jgi:hypothetical protein
VVAAYKHSFSRSEIVDPAIMMKMNSVSQTPQCYGGGLALVFSSDELLPYALDDLHEKKYRFIQCIRKEIVELHELNDKNGVLCAIPVSVLAPKLTMKCIRDIVSLHNMYIPSRINVRDAQILLQEHMCHDCSDFVSLFVPHNIVSNAQRQHNWYKKLDSNEKADFLASRAESKSSSEYRTKD